MRKTETAMSTLPNFDNFKPSLKKAMDYLSSTWRTFRAEKMPLCYIEWYEWASTETRKIVKEEERIVHFLDSREQVHETDFYHEKLNECSNCDLNTICSWIYERNKFYNYVNVYPRKLDKQELNLIINKIKNED